MTKPPAGKSSPLKKQPARKMPAKALVAAADKIRGAAKRKPTDDHVEGPFYRPCPPETHDLYPADCDGAILHFSGSVHDTSGKPLPGTLIEIWGADDHGNYDNSDPHKAPARDFYRCRAKLWTGRGGLFAIRTVLPANYPVTPKWMRVKHLHFKLFGPCMIGLTTEIELLPDDYTKQDQLYNANLAVHLKPRSDERGKKAFETSFDFVLTPIEQPGYLIAASHRLR